MDEIVKQALAKWPNVPHCYGWLALDARGNWRMRDERAQMLQLPGDQIRHATLTGFINRNYMHDANGRWYFQNGPQRVYVSLEATPFVARIDPQYGFTLHTGSPLPSIASVWLTDAGTLLLQSGEIIAQVDDRDLAHCINGMRMHGRPVDDAQLLNWLAQDGTAPPLEWQHDGKTFPVRHIASEAIERQFGFVRAPQPPASAK
jgi:hypothetical protein